MVISPLGMAARTGRRAFTLIELLVTVVIISILAGLIMAGTSRALQSARKTEADSNMRMIGQGIHNDADQLHPGVASAPWRTGTPAGIIHGKQRLALFFGGHVAPIDEDQLETPPFVP